MQGLQVFFRDPPPLASLLLSFLDPFGNSNLHVFEGASLFQDLFELLSLAVVH